MLYGRMHQLIGRMRSRRGLPTVAGQVFLLQAILILALAAAAVAALMFQYRGDAEREARTRSLAVASAVAASPTVREALSRANPTVVLQPQAEETRRRTAVDFVVVMSPTGIRYTHPNPAQIGRMGTSATSRQRSTAGSSPKRLPGLWAPRSAPSFPSPQMTGGSSVSSPRASRSSR